MAEAVVHGREVETGQAGQEGQGVIEVELGQGPGSSRMLREALQGVRGCLTQKEGTPNAER